MQCVNDYMHSVLLGVTKKLLFYWLKGKVKETKFGKDIVKSFDNNLLSLNNYIPSEFCRKHRSVVDFERWKATEFRFFLLYSGPVVLKSVLSRDYYEHFLSLHCAIRILCSKKLFRNLNTYANNLLKYFIETGNDLYEHFCIPNVHSLSHLALDSFRFGNLDIFSCFPFESFLQYIKKLPTKVNMQFEQVIKRIIERDEILECDYLKDTNEIVLCNPMDEINCFRIATFKDFLIKCNPKLLTLVACELGFVDTYVFSIKFTLFVKLSIFSFILSIELLNCEIRSG